MVYIQHACCMLMVVVIHIVVVVVSRRLFGDNDGNVVIVNIVDIIVKVTIWHVATTKHVLCKQPHNMTTSAK